MSRGIGSTQREAMLVLWDHEEGVAGGIPLAQLKRYISTDRSNARRAIRGLIDRGLVAETTDEEGVRRVSLTGGGHLACWLASYADERLTLGAVPSRPLYLSALYGEGGEDGGDPHGTTEPPWNNDAVSESPVNDNGASGPELGDAMPMGIPHASTPRSPDWRVNDNTPYRPGIGLEIAARMAREVLERLDEEERA